MSKKVKKSKEKYNFNSKQVLKWCVPALFASFILANSICNFCVSANIISSQWQRSVISLVVLISFFGFLIFCATTSRGEKIYDLFSKHFLGISFQFLYIVICLNFIQFELSMTKAEMISLIDICWSIVGISLVLIAIYRIYMHSIQKKNINESQFSSVFEELCRREDVNKNITKNYFYLVLVIVGILFLSISTLFFFIIYSANGLGLLISQNLCYLSLFFICNGLGNLACEIVSNLRKEAKELKYKHAFTDQELLAAYCLDEIIKNKNTRIEKQVASSKLTHPTIEEEVLKEEATKFFEQHLQSEIDKLLK